MKTNSNYGWLVVSATFLVGFITDGIVFSFGILLTELLDAFNQGRASTVIIGSIATGVMHLIGPVAGILSEKYGCRSVVIAGSLISFSGFVISVFVDKVTYLYITYGLLGGLGFGLMYLPASVCVIQHFDKQRSLANGIAMCGSGAGSFAFNLVTGYLLETYGWRGTILIQAGIMLNGIVCGLIFVSPQKSGDTTKHSERNIKCSHLDHEEAVCLQPTENSTTSFHLDNTKYNVKSNYMAANAVDVNHGGQATFEINSEIYLHNSGSFDIFDGNTNRNSEKAIVRSSDTNCTSSKPENKDSEVILQKNIFEDMEVDRNFQANLTDVKKNKRVCKELCDVSLLRNTKLLAFLLSGFFVNLAFTVPFNFIPDQAIENGLDKHEAYWLASSIGITNTISRIIIGWIADRKCVNRLILLEFMLFSVGIATATSVFLMSFPAKMLYTCAYGFLIGGYVTLCPVVLADLFGVDVIGRSFGLFMFFVGISGIVSSPIAGWLFDYTGSYTISFITAGSEFILGAVVLLFPFLFEKIKMSKIGLNIKSLVFQALSIRTELCSTPISLLSHLFMYNVGLFRKPLNYWNFTVNNTTSDDKVSSSVVI